MPRCLRGYVLDTKIGPMYDVTQPLVLIGIPQDVSAGKCVAAMISPPRQYTSCSSKVVSVNAAIANLLHRARMPWILEHSCDSLFWTYRKSRLLRHSLARPGRWPIFASLDHHAESGLCFLLATWRQQGFAPYCAKTWSSKKKLPHQLRS